MNEAVRLPGVSNAWTMPIKNRIDMLTTGMRTPVGVKILGTDTQTIQRIGIAVEQALRSVPGTRNAFSERAAGGFFLDVDWNREQLARYNLTMDQAQAVITSAIGGENVSTTVEGRERYPINVRYQRAFRSDPNSIGRILVPVMNGQTQIPISQLGAVRIVNGPSMYRDENGLLAGYVYVDVSSSDLGGYVERARRLIESRVKTPPGYSLVWSGQYEAMARVKQRLLLIVPLTLALVLLLLFVNTGSAVKTMLIVLAVPFSAVGAIWLLYLLGYNMSIGVWVGLIALLGVDAETGVFMLLYLDLSYEQAKQAGHLRSLADLQHAVMDGAVKRIRPKFMTVAVMFMGLVPVMWSTGAGADVMKRIAAPMIGGVFTSFLLELVVYPALYEVWKWHFDLKPKLAHAVPADATALTH
jgi:Cu(I)/Ag(I) efflux system membrane protein CusA/SilA